MNKKRFFGFLLIALAVLLYLVAATLLMTYQYRCFMNEKFIQVRVGSKSSFCIKLLKGDKAAFTIKSPKPINMELTYLNDTQRIRLAVMDEVLSLTLPLKINLTSTYCLILEGINAPTEVYVKVSVCRYTLTERGYSLTSVSATALLLIGIVLSISSFMGGKGFRQELSVGDKALCKVISINKHRCTLSSLNVTDINKILEILVRELKYRLISNIENTIFILRYRGKLIPKTFNDKSRTLILSIKEGLRGITLILDYEVTSWFSGGVRDLEGIVNEIRYLLNRIR